MATWSIFIIGGFLYSSIVITAVREWRTDYRRPIAVFLFGSIIYWVGPIFVLGYPACQSDYRQPSYVIFSNFFCFGLVQLIAQWFTFLDDIPALNKIMFTADAIKKFTIVQWSIIIGVVGLIVGLISWQFYLLYLVGRLGSYLGILIGILVLFGFIAYSLRHRYYIHFHHYSVGLLVPFFPVPSPVSSIAQAILTGICIEGLSRWGPDPFFIPHHNKPSSKDTTSPNNVETQRTMIVSVPSLPTNNRTDDYTVNFPVPPTGTTTVLSPLEWGNSSSSNKTNNNNNKQLIASIS